VTVGRRRSRCGPSLDPDDDPSALRAPTGVDPDDLDDPVRVATNFGRRLEFDASETGGRKLASLRNTRDESGGMTRPETRALADHSERAGSPSLRDPDVPIDHRRTDLGERAPDGLGLEVLGPAIDAVRTHHHVPLA
jgi:hypothetical protein